MGANNHTTVVPKENNDSISYDADSEHDAYMCALRNDMIRSGSIDV